MDTFLNIPIKLLNSACRPYRKYIDDAGFDLRARYPVKLHVGGIEKIPVGVCMEIPPGYYGDIRSRSGLTAKGIICPGGTIDASFRGEIHVVLVNLSGAPYEIKPYERIAQLTITPIPQVELLEVNCLSDTERGEKGFGSTGRM